MPRYSRLLLPAVACGVALVSGCASSAPVRHVIDDAASRPLAAVPCTAGQPSAGCTSPDPSSTARPSASPAKPAHPRTHAVQRPAAPRYAPGSAQPAPPSAAGGSSIDHEAIMRVFALINRARARAGLPAYTMLNGLQVSSRRHNNKMAFGCHQLTHQCPGEPPLGTRLTNAGVHWTTAGENCGEGGAVANTAAAIAGMATGLTRSMLAEQPPNDGHRLNILSKSFTHIGVAVVRDSTGTVWLTQDFAN